MIGGQSLKLKALTFDSPSSRPYRGCSAGWNARRITINGYMIICTGGQGERAKHANACSIGPTPGG